MGGPSNTGTTGDVRFIFICEDAWECPVWKHSLSTGGRPRFGCSCSFPFAAVCAWNCFRSLALIGFFAVETCLIVQRDTLKRRWTILIVDSTVDKYISSWQIHWVVKETVLRYRSGFRRHRLMQLTFLKSEVLSQRNWKEWLYATLVGCCCSFVRSLIRAACKQCSTLMRWIFANSWVV